MLNNTSEKITTVCISTCNRPELLNSSLQNLIENFKKYSRSPRILIIDDSEDPESFRKTREIADEYTSIYVGKIEYADRNDRKAMAIALAKEKNIPEDVVIFGLCGDKTSTLTAGSNQNTFLLKTRGEKILMTDDDVVYNFFSPITESPQSFTIEDPYDYYFIDEKNPIPSSSLFKKTGDDFISAHENILGTESDFNTAVLDSYMGFYGDSPMESHMPLLLLPQVCEQFRHVSPSEYEKNKLNRKLLRIPPSLSYYQGVMCITMVVGIDNRHMVPPFLPLGRGHDLVFGVTRHKAFPSSVSAHLPLAIEHKRPSAERRHVSYDCVRESTKMCRIIASLVEENGDVAADPETNLSIIGKRFVQLASEPPLVFNLLMEAQCMNVLKAFSEKAQEILEANPDMPEFWKRDIETICQSSMNTDSSLFMQDITKTITEDRMHILQRWIGLHGQLLQVWKILCN